jgi:hypothetical protein
VLWKRVAILVTADRDGALYACGFGSGVCGAGGVPRWRDAAGSIGGKGTFTAFGSVGG